MYVGQAEKLGLPEGVDRVIVEAAFVDGYTAAIGHAHEVVYSVFQMAMSMDFSASEAQDQA